jgi:quinoprotein glucose dehydrogenase
LIDDHLYLCTPFNRILAIHAETGAEGWSYAPDIDLEGFPMPRCRGVTQWTDARIPEGEPLSPRGHRSVNGRTCRRLGCR